MNVTKLITVKQSHAYSIGLILQVFEIVVQI